MIKASPKTTKAYALEARDGGYAVICLKIQNDKVVERTVVHEPDFFAISSAILSLEFKKDIEQ